MASERARLLHGSASQDDILSRSTDNSFAKIVVGGGHQGDGPHLPMPATVESHRLDKAVNRRRKISIIITYITMFISSITFSIVLSSLWPYLLQVDPSATASFLGYVVAAYSLGQLVASPFFGVWSNHRPVREPLVVSTIINVAANIVYAYANAFPAGKKWALLVSRAFVGFGAGNVAVARAYVSAATTEKERTGAMAGLSACQAIGFILGPGLGLAFQPFGPTGVHWDAIKLELNLYTGPGFLSALLGVFNLILLIVVFREYRIYTKVKRVTFKACYRSCVRCCSNGCPRQQEDKEEEESEETEGSEESEDVQYSDCEDESSLNRDRHAPNLSFWRRISAQFDPVAVVVSIVLFFVVLFVFAVVETLVSPLSLDEFGWSKADSTLYNNIMFVCSALVAVATFIAIKFISKVADERNIFMVGFFIVAFGLYIVMPFPGRSMPIQLELLSGPYVNESESIHIPPANVSNFTYPYNGGGCDVIKQPWCLYVPGINLWQFLIGFALVSIGYPIGNVMSYSIFSKILGSAPQGTMMGWLTAAGSLARTVGPLFVSTVYDNFGAQVLFAVCIGIVAVAILTLLVFYRKLVPNTRHVNRLPVT